MSRKKTYSVENEFIPLTHEKYWEKYNNTELYKYNHNIPDVEYVISQELIEKAKYNKEDIEKYNKTARDWTNLYAK